MCVCVFMQEVINLSDGDDEQYEDEEEEDDDV